MPPKPGSKQKRGAARRKAIITEAVAEFSRHGFRGRGLANLAERVGLTEAGLYHHFGSKDELIKAVLAERHADGLQRREKFLSDGGVRAIKAFPTFMRSVLDEPQLAEFAYVMLAESLPPDSPTRGYYEERYGRVRELFAGWNRQAAIELGGPIDEAAWKAYAQLTQAVMDGVQALWFLAPDDVDVEDIMERFSEMLLRSLGPKPEPTD